MVLIHYTDMSNFLPSLSAYTHRFLMLFTLVGGAPFCSGRWLTQRLKTGQYAENK